MAQLAVAPMSLNLTQISEAAARTVTYRWVIYAVCVAVSVACNYILGKDMAWDTLNYHLYLGFSALNDRFGQDYFAAGLLSYLNPYAYIPFYAMVHAKLPALVIGSIFAAAHSIILWLTFELGVLVCPSKQQRSRTIAGVCAIAFALMNPVLLQQLGSCFADITTAELALAGWVLLAGVVRAPRSSRTIVAGLILGAASALKLSNALPAVSAFAMFVCLPTSWRNRVRHVVLYGITLGAGFVLVAAPWSYRLEQKFGNPLFPMLNSLFRSPQFTTEPMLVYRFIPETLVAALWRPFAMVNPVAMVHEELRAPDPRYAVIILLAMLLLLRWAWRRFGRTTASPESPHPTPHARVLTALGSGLGANWVLWLLTSGNSRYVLTMACVASVVIVGLLFELFESRPKVGIYLLASIFVTQAVQLSVAAEYRWNGVPWGGPWFDISVPERLKTEPYLYLTYGLQSNSFIAPFVAEGSGFVNFAGGYTLNAEGTNGTQVKALIKRFSPNVRIVFGARKYHKDIATQALIPTGIDDALQPFGLITDTDDCAIITVHGLPPTDIRAKNVTSKEPEIRDTTYLATCRAVPYITDRSAQLTRQHEIDLVFDRLEDACPKLFQPRRLSTMREGDVWRRFYGGTDILAWISMGHLKFQDLSRPNGVIDLGPEGDWVRAPLSLDCGVHDGLYFAHIVEPSK